MADKLLRVAKKMYKPGGAPKKAGMHRPEGAGNFDNMDDYNIVNSIDVNEIKLYGMTVGSVLFHDGTKIAEDNFNLYWNNATKELQPNLMKITSDGTQASPALKFNDTNTGFYKSGDSIRLSLNNSTKWTVDSTGVGIGTASPNAPLHVASGRIQVTGQTPPSAGAGIEIGYSTETDNGFIIGYDRDVSEWRDMSLQGLTLSLYANGAESLHIDASGNVGIGTTSPGNKLDIVTGETISSALHIGEADNEGIYLTSTVPSQFVLSSGAEYLNGSWYARGTEATLWLSYLGETYFYGNDSLTDGNTFTPTIRMIIKADGNVDTTKTRQTITGGFAIKLTNKTGANTVAGQLVAVYTTTAIDNAFVTCSGSDDNVIGIVLDAGVSDGSEAWVVISGIADVLMDGGGSARGDRLISSTTAGSADVWNTGGSNATHFLEIGHCIETRTGAGLSRAVLHFN